MYYAKMTVAIIALGLGWLCAIKASTDPGLWLFAGIAWGFAFYMAGRARGRSDA